MCVINGLTEDCGAEIGNVFNISKHRWAHWRSPQTFTDSYNDAYIPYDVNMQYSARRSFTRNCCLDCLHIKCFIPEMLRKICNVIKSGVSISYYNVQSCSMSSQPRVYSWMEYTLTDRVNRNTCSAAVQHNA